MINTETTQVTYLTRADQTTRYSIPFVYNKNELTDAPELTVTLNGTELVFGTDYTVSESGLQLVSAVEEGLELIITRTSVFEQLRDFQTGIIDPEQIEGGFDDSVMRDQELKRGLSDLSDALDEKQDIITDLDTIRSGAAAGATALQPTDVATVATTGSYNDLLDRPIIPSVGAGVITITQGGAIKGSFSVNQNGDATIEVDEGGGGAVDSVNGKIGVVVLDSSDVGALPDTTKYAASIVLSVDPSTFVVTARLKDQNNNNIGAAQTIDLPLESVVVSGAYDSATKEVVLILEGGSTVRFSVADLVSGLQTEITAQNKLDAALVDDTNSVNKFVTAADKSTWSGKQDYISDLSTIRTGAAAGATAVQPADLATVATSGSYSDLVDKPTIPSVGAGTITITQGGVTKGSFDVNQSGNTTIDVDAGGDELPDQTGQSGKFLTTDGTDASWGTINALQNTAIGTDSLTILGTAATAQNAINIGIGSSANRSSTAIGHNAAATARGVALGASATISGVGPDTLSCPIAIGYQASATAAGAIQIGRNGNNAATNSDANTFKVGNANGNFEIMSADGTVPTARLTKVNTTATLAVADWSSKTQTVTVSGVKADSVVFVSPAPASASDYASAGILCTSQSADSLTFTATTTPSVAIDVNIVCL